MSNAQSIPSASDLSYFFEAASTLNFSRAAERLGISQPSLSLSIQRIEAILGEPIFLRSKRGVTLTQAGRQLFGHTRTLMQAWSEVRTKATASVGEIGGRYVIGCHPSVAIFSLPGFLADAMAKHPKLELQLVHDLSRKITEGVISASLDMGIVVNPVRHPDLLLQKIAEDNVAFWQPATSSRVSAIKNSDVLIYNPEMMQSQTLIKKLFKSGVHIARTIETSNLEVIAELTASHCGIGILPTRVALKASKKLMRVVKTPVFQDEIYIAMRSENRGIATLKYLRDAIIKNFPKAGMDEK